MPTVVIGTAGHIDHGKTALLRALTGIDADRLPEEKARGMTIDVGYAHLVFDDGIELDFVDVPGHDRLIGNMLVGAGEIDAAMLVVAADDGPRPQTIEHLQLLDALGIRDGIAVISKVDLVDADRVAAVAAEVGVLLEGTSLTIAPVLAASAVTGEGLEELRVALRTLHEELRHRWGFGDRDAESAAPLRLAIDRAFSVKGRGVVVTGSLRGGAVTPGAALRREPGGEVVRVREVQVHGTRRDRHDGGRTALNITGLPAGALQRGDVLTSGPRLRGSVRLLVDMFEAWKPGRASPWPPAARRVTAFPAASAKGRAWLRLHIGTDQVDASIRRVPGLESTAMLSLARATATFPGDRAVLREPASGRIVASVRVLDASPPRAASRRRMTPKRVEALALAIGFEYDAVLAARIELHGALVTDFSDGAQTTARLMSFATDVSADLTDAAMAAVATHHRESPLSPGLPLPRARAALLRRLRSLATVERRDADAAAATITRLIDGLVAAGRLARRGESLRDPARTDDRPAELVAAMDRLESALDVPAPPPLDMAAAAAGCPPEGIRALIGDGRIVRLGPDLAWATPAYQRLAAVALGRARVGPVTPAALRDATATSRKYVLAILEDLDRRGILQRTPEGHVPGPRAPAREAAT